MGGKLQIELVTEQWTHVNLLISIPLITPYYHICAMSKFQTMVIRSNSANCGFLALTHPPHIL